MNAPEVLNFHAHFDDVAGYGGENYADFPIATNDVWEVMLFGGSSSRSNCEAQMLYSEDGGVTFINPFGGGQDVRIRVLHLSEGVVAETLFAQPLIFFGGAGHLIRLKVINYNTLSADDISAWINGRQS